MDSQNFHGFTWSPESFGALSRNTLTEAGDNDQLTDSGFAGAKHCR